MTRVTFSGSAWPPCPRAADRLHCSTKQSIRRLPLSCFLPTRRAPPERSRPPVTESIRGVGELMFPLARDFVQRVVLASDEAIPIPSAPAALSV